MQPVSRFHAAFADALRDPSPQSVPADLDADQARRFAVYRNNVHLALNEALGAAYPVVRRLVGDAFFSAMARAFAALERYRPASVALYGKGFATFIDGFAPARSLPYLADVARLERAWLEACHAADAPPLEAAMLAAHGEAVAELQLTAHPAAHIVTSRFPILDIWHANSAGGSGQAVLEAGGQCVLVTRPYFDVQLQAIEPAAAPFITAMLDRATANQAYEQAGGETAEFDVAGVFRAMIDAGAFASYSSSGD